MKSLWDAAIDAKALVISAKYLTVTMQRHGERFFLVCM